MEAREFDRITEQVLKKISETLTSKAGEYARGNRLSNFKKFADFLGVSPERALIGLVTEHYVALVDFVNDIEQGKNQSMDRWDEKTHDIMAYMVLMKALNIERERNEKQKVDIINDEPDIRGISHHRHNCVCSACRKLKNPVPV